ncbi:hypothetical protein ANCCAN_25054 [Ancylostoma caninum]|uniref:Uncharacterized protein n=1 Tax=Ancylostoma caninum TaxID=29170 RepID=A0A368FE76_ANCCA|nr:hypothetical protein ANCCAN_25054 [Ancylostoma caninum]
MFCKTTPVNTRESSAIKSLYCDRMEETSTMFENGSTTLAPPAEGNMGLLMNESVSTTNMQAIEVVPVVAAGVVFGTLVAIGTIATAIFIAVLIRGRRTFAEVGKASTKCQSFVNIPG